MTKRMRVAVGAWVASVVCVSAAVGQGGPPRGVYCSCPPTSERSHSVLPEVAALPFVDGILVRVQWDLLEPEPGVYDWSLLDAELDLAESLGTKVALGVICGGTGEPAWLYEPHGGGPGAAGFDYDFGDRQETMPVPWDEVFLTDWGSFVAALGSRYAGRDVVTLVHMTHSTRNGFEMQIPFSRDDEQQWAAIGYTAERHAGSWLEVMDAFGAAFPNHALDVDLHPVLGSSEVASAVAGYGADEFGDRFGVFAAWWTQRNALEVYPEMYDLLLDSADRSFGTVQLARSATVHGEDSFGDGGFAGAFGLALSGGVRYFEVWNSDLLNQDLQGTVLDAWEAAHACAADFDGDGSATTRDVLAFLNAWTAGNPLADVNGDGVVDTQDVLVFLNLWRSGC